MAAIASVEEQMVLSAIDTTIKTYGESEDLARLLKSAGERSFKLFCVDIVDFIRSETTVGEKALVRFHQLSINALPSLWEALCTMLGLPILRALTCQTVNKQLLSQVLQERTSSSQGPSRKRQVTMCSEEENAVRYASGYVAIKVMRLFEKDDSTKAAQFVDCLSHMALSGEESSFYAYTKEWIDSVNRGGLFCINETAFLFFRAVELITQVHLPHHLQTPCGSKGMLISQIIDDEDVQFHWSLLSLDIEDEHHSAELLKTIVQQWIKIRGFAITSTWMEGYKRSTQKTTKGKKSLRKELHKKSADKNNKKSTEEQ